MIISERIFYIMEQKNMSQLELSRRTGIATSNISDWKKKKTNPKADCLLSICDALDIKQSAFGFVFFFFQSLMLLVAIPVLLESSNCVMFFCSIT